MEISDFGRHAFSICATVAMLDGCNALRQAQDDTQPPLGAPGSMPQTSATVSARTLAHRNLTTLPFKVLHSFEGDPDGERATAGLEITNDTTNDTLYGTTLYGGTRRVGTVYSIDIEDGTEKVLHSFGSGSDGVLPYAGLIHGEGNDPGALYGTTRDGGASDKGTVYGITLKGTESVLHSFTGGADGAKPLGSLAEVDYRLFGTTRDGGASDKGTVYRTYTDGRFYTVLHSFGGGSDGAYPEAGLTASLYGFKLYGTTREGGTSNKGTVYSINPDGMSERVLHSFGGGSDGAYPQSGLIRVNSMLYGTTAEGGTSNKGTVYSIDADGTEKVLHSFGGGTDGDTPIAGLIYVNGTLYGTTFLGGGYGCSRFGCGTVYSLGRDGTDYRVEHSFSDHDGTHPEAPLFYEDYSGMLYGTTSKGGAYDGGTVYAF